MISEHDDCHLKDSCSPQHVANGPARDFVPALSLKKTENIVIFLLHVHQIRIFMRQFTTTRCFEVKK